MKIFHRVLTAACMLLFVQVSLSWGAEGNSELDRDIETSKVSFRLNGTVGDILAEIKRQTGLNIVLDQESRERKFPITAENVSISSTLRMLGFAVSRADVDKNGEKNVYIVPLAELSKRHKKLPATNAELESYIATRRVTLKLDGTVNDILAEINKQTGLYIVVDKESGNRKFPLVMENVTVLSTLKLIGFKVSRAEIGTGNAMKVYLAPLTKVSKRGKKSGGK